MSESNNHDTAVAAKIYGLLTQLKGLKADAQTALEKAEHDLTSAEQPAPFDESAAQIQLADSAIHDAINGTETVAELAADLAIKRSASVRACDAALKARIKADGDIARLKAELSAIGSRISATDSALRNELASIAAKRVITVKEAFDEAVKVVFQLAAEYSQLEDLTGASDGRPLDWVGFSMPAVVTAPYWTGSDRNIHQPIELINEARADFLESIGVSHE